MYAIYKIYERNWYEMDKKGKIGVQMMMLKKEIAEQGMYGVLEHLTQMGFHAVEVSQIATPPEVIAEMQRAQTELGMEIVALSAMVRNSFKNRSDIPMDSLEENFDKIVADCHALGCKVVRLGMIDLSLAYSPEAMLQTCDEMESYAKRLKEHGIDLYFHAHTFEFHRWQGKPMMSHFLERTSALGFELDTHWLQRGGMSPAYVSEFKGRILIFHLKDYRIGLLPRDKDIGSMGYNIFGDIEQFAEVGEGCLDIPAYITAGLESGSKYFMIEQDQGYGRTAYESLAISRDNLVKMGYGSWF